MNPAPGPTPLVRFEDWTISFPSPEGRFLAVESLNGVIFPGESVGIVGESGSGKTLTALSVMQLLPMTAQSEGKVLWDGATDLKTAAAPALRALRGKEVGMVFQEPLSSLNPVMKCGEQVAEVLRTHLGLDRRGARAATLEWFEKVQLTDVERIYNAWPHQLSGGQRQRVMIAMALCAKPRLLVADEPTTALDVTVQQAILELLAQLRAELGIAILFISHDLGVVRKICDRVWVMQHGKVVEHGKVAQVFLQPQHPYTKGLLACRPSVQTRQQRLLTVADFVSQTEESKLPASESEIREEAVQARQATLANQPILLQAEYLRVVYATQRNWLGKVVATVNGLDDVSLYLRKGETLGVVGESGSGKTTLGKALLRLLPLQSGIIHFQGTDLAALSEKQLLPLRPRIQMVFQDPFSTLNPRMTIGEWLTEPLYVHFPEWTTATVKERVAGMLNRVGMDASALARYPKDFSGGQRQRIGIAAALLLAPEVLICDESVSALDVSVQAQVLNLLRDLQAESGFSMIFISHDMAVIRFLADRVMVMQKGKVVETGPADEVFLQPAHSYTQLLLNAVL
ncbi:MAG: ABC transporter ATP-binding protein [Saprospiraceae bacterium]